MANEEIDYEEKKRLAQASLKIIKRIYELSPQFSDESLHYLVAGSLATNILPFVKKMQTMNIDRSGKRISGVIEFEIAEEIRKEFLKLVRPSRSEDIDIINVNNGPYECAKDGAKPTSTNIKNGMEDEFYLIYPHWKIASGYMMDELESAEKMERFHVAKVELEDGTTLFMPSLDSILYFKLREASILKDSKPGKVDDLRKLYEIFSKIDSPTLKKLLDRCRDKIEKVISRDEKEKSSDDGRNE